jgi:drug/metabolite transporter (DMT)-like permease
LTGIAIGLVLASAFLHASWNLLAKRAGGGAPLVWLFDALTLVIFAPVILVSLFFVSYEFSLGALGFMVVSAGLHLAYFILLQRGYRIGDLSLVYPLARGTGPVLSTIVAIIILGERPSLLAIVGAFLVAASVFALTGGPGKLAGKGARWAVGYGLLTGVFIAGYTLWDKQAVSAYGIPPLLFYYGSVMVRVLILCPYAWHMRDKVRFEWDHHRFEAVGVALLSTISYFLILSVLVFTPVSYVAPAREISILIGTIMGTRLLAEADGRRRLPAALGMVIGVVALALG